MKPISRMLVLLVALAALAASKPPPPRRHAAPLSHADNQRRLMGATLTGIVESRADSATGARVLEAMFDEAARLDTILAASDSTTELARLNRLSASRRFACSAELYAAIDSALALADETDGAYDPSVGALVRLWQPAESGATPDAGAIADARSRVSWRAVMREPTSRVVRLRRAGMTLDLDGVARGFTLDRAEATLRGLGISRALMDWGDQALAMTNREPWRWAIAYPGDPARGAFHVAISNAAIATAATADARDRPAREAGPGSPARILDPRTGMPVRGTASVTVVARSASRAAALAIGLRVMGRERAAEFALAHPELAVLWLEPDVDGLNAWGWNLPTIAPDSGVVVRWKTRL